MSHDQGLRHPGRPRRKEGQLHASSPTTPMPTPPRATPTPASSSATTRVMVIDTQATPVMAQDVIRRIREVTDKPIKYVVLTHYHAVRVLGASAYEPEHIIASQDTYDLIVERGEQDKASEIGRFPRLFQRRRDRAAGPDLADHDLHRQDDAVARQARSAAAAARPRPHQGRHGRLAAAGAARCSPATWSSSTPRRMPATPTSRTGRRRSTTSPR